MPIVDYNRIYHVRSRERQPVLYSPGMIPDAAGAMMRANAPALSARLADAEARARERQGNLRAQYAALGNLIRVGGQVGETVARAVERRDEADFNALAAAWQNHMNAGARDAFGRKYARGGENGDGADGPARAIRELDAAFDGTEAFGNARDGVKQRFATWREQHRRPYYDKADDRQTDLADAWQKQVLEDRFTAADAGIKQLYEIGDNDKWAAAVGDAVEAKIALARWGYEKNGLALSPELQNKIESELMQRYFQDRASFQLARVAAADTPEGAKDYEAEVVALINSGVLDDPTKQSVEGLLAKARESRERNVAAATKADIAELQNAAMDWILDPSNESAWKAAVADVKGRGRVTDADVQDVGTIAYGVQNKRAEQAARVAINKILDAGSFDEYGFADTATQKKISEEIDKVPFASLKAELRQAFVYGPEALRRKLSGEGAAKAPTWTDAQVETYALFGEPELDEKGAVRRDAAGNAVFVPSEPFDRVQRLFEDEKRGACTGAQVLKAIDRMGASFKVTPELQRDIFKTFSDLGIDLAPAFRKESKPGSGLFEPEKDFDLDATWRQNIVQSKKPAGWVRSYLVGSYFGKNAEPSITHYDFTGQMLLKCYDLAVQHERLRAQGLTRESLEYYLKREIKDSMEFKDFSRDKAMQLLDDLSEERDAFELSSRRDLSWGVDSPAPRLPPSATRQP